MSMLELKYQRAKDMNRSIICERLARKASHIMQRIEQARATIAVMFRRDWDEAIGMNLKIDLRDHPERYLPMVIKEKTDGMVQRDTHSG